MTAVQERAWREALGGRTGQDAQGRQGRRRDARGDPRGDPTGRDHRHLDEVAAEVSAKRGARSNFLNYHGFPAVICTSPNDMIVHGIPGDYVLDEGDIISVDCGAIVEGYHGDAAYTAGVGDISEEAQRLLDVTERALWAGIDQLGRATGSTKSAARCRTSPRRGVLGRTRVRRPRHRHRDARGAPGAELLAGHARAAP